MTLSAGTRFGVYEVVSLLGVGGMGEVYRATDSRLHRDVALKVLPDVFASDPDRLARFQREAQVLASLNHPHIGAIHGLEQSGSIQALVLELVDGPTLAERIAHGPIPTDEALPIARQIAEALEAAHERGIVHRDLKPANIKLRADGTAKVLDFGLAKALEAPNPAASSAGSLNTPTITSPAMMTAAGIILGTAAYMSPEQVKGSPADRRSDVWAFGCVLYEMLSGFRAFAGDDVADTLAGVLRGEPRWEGLPPDVPDPVRRLLRRCLEKDRRRRLPDIAVVRQEIDEALLAPVAYPDPSTRRVVVAQRPLWQRAWPVVLAGLVAGALAAWAAWTFKPDAPRAVLR
jgi:serine/threonine protein kinase